MNFFTPKYRLSLDGDLLVYDKNFTVDFIKKIITKHKIKGIEVSEMLKSKKLDSLNILEEFDFLESLSINSGGHHNYTFLDKLINLKKLYIYAPYYRDVHLGMLSRLEELVINWIPKEIKDLEKCISLKELLLIEFKEKNLKVISELVGLQILDLRTSTITSLDGVANLISLKELKLGNCSRLVSINGIESLDNLRTIRFDTCKKITDFSILAESKNVEEIEIDNCGQLTNLNFIKDLPFLRKLWIGGKTFILDYDEKLGKKIQDFKYFPC